MSRPRFHFLLFLQISSTFLPVRISSILGTPKQLDEEKEENIPVEKDDTNDDGDVEVCEK